MANQFSIVVGGMGQLAQALSSTRLFANVVPVESTGGLREVLQSRSLTPGVDDKIFIFANNLPVDTQQSLQFLIGKLTAMRARVIVLGVTPAGRALVDACPGAGLLDGNVFLNSVLGAIASLPGVTGVSPVPEGANVKLFGDLDDAVAYAPRPATPPAPPAFTPPPAAPPAFTPPPAAPPAPPAFTPPPTAPPAFTPPPAAPPALTEPTPPAFNVPAPYTPPSAPEPTYTPAPTPQPAPNYPATTQQATPPAANPFVQTNPFGTPPPSPRARSPLSAGNGLAVQGGTLAVPGAPDPHTGRLGRVITVTAPKGGTGKSTLSLNLAAYLGLRLRGTGRNVCIIDANVQQADTGKYLNAYTPNVEDLLRDPAAIHPDRINQYLLHKPQLNMSALLGPATPDTANPVHFTGQRYSQILQALRPNFDYIFIDTPVAEFYHKMFQVFALPNADFIIVAVTPNVPTLVSTDMWLRQITAPKSAHGMGLDESRIGIALNRAEEGIGCSEDEVRQNLAEWRYLGAIPETKEWKLANNACEIVATKNYHELNEAFANVLAQSTGETWLVDGMNLDTSVNDGLGAKFKRLFRGRKG